MKTPHTIEEAQKLLSAKKISALELVKEHLANIKRFNGDLNVFLNVNEDVLADAKKIDKEISRDRSLFQKKPLAGIPIAHKDVFLTKGLKTTAASSVLSDYIPQYSATAVTRLESAGALTLGKVNCDAWAHGSSGENSDFGSTKNPFDRSKVAGGSSSGSAASLSSNMALAATATDTCGSTRLPANFNYVYGLKPTYGRISRYGVVAMASSLDTVGFMARSSGDCRLLFSLLNGQDGFDATACVPMQKVKEIRKSAKKKLGIPREFFDDGADQVVIENVKQAIKVYEKIGWEVYEVSLPTTRYALAAYYIIQPAEVSSNLARYDGVRFGEDRAKFTDEAKRRIMLGTYVLSSGYYDAYYIKAMKVRAVIKAEMDKIFETVDALIAPVSSSLPFKLGEKTQDPLKMYLTDIYSASANLSGIPALSVPFNFSKEGLPMGFQLMSARNGDELLFDMADEFEKETGYVPCVAKL